MKQFFLIWILIFFDSGLGFATPDLSQPLNIQQCIELAIKQNATVDDTIADIQDYRARLTEVQANYYPKLSVLGYLAPMFTVKGDAFSSSVERKFDLGSWGPSTHLEMLLAMPLYSFGRLEAGEAAASARLEVEKSRLRETQNHVKVEVTKFYYSYLYAITILKHLQTANERLTEIREKAQILYDESTGKVTKVDLMKLQYADSEVQKHILVAIEGETLALSALKHAMGLIDTTELQLTDTSIPRPDKNLTLPDELEMQSIARHNRPEWEQIQHGLTAVTALRKSEELSHLPVVFIAGTVESNWSPTRDDATNPYHYDPYNDLFGGIAIGFKLDLDLTLRKSKIDSAIAKQQKVDAAKKLAISGIPLQIKKARSEVERYLKQIDLSHSAIKASNKWVVFSSAAYISGTGEVKDVLEGMAASLAAKRDYYEGMLNYYVAFAELDYALGQ